MPFPGVRVAVAESMSRDLMKVSEWCDLWGMKLNASKTKIMIVSRLRTIHPQSPADTHLRLLDRVVSGASFLTGVCV